VCNLYQSDARTEVALISISPGYPKLVILVTHLNKFKTAVHLHLRVISRKLHANITKFSGNFADGVEHCLTETFHARCRQRNEVILMDSARFGRMELGRCVTRNFGHVGCAADVISQLDAACSGRTYCDLSVSDPSLVRMKPCPKDFSAYLDALYHCVPGKSIQA